MCWFSQKDELGDACFLCTCLQCYDAHKGRNFCYDAAVLVSLLFLLTLLVHMVHVGLKLYHPE